MHLVMDDRELDLAQREADLALRMRAPVQADLIQRKLFTVHYHMYASKDVSAEASGLRNRWRKSPTTPSSSMAKPAVPEIRDINWLLEAFKKNAGPGSTGRVIRINNITGILQATEAGLGIGVVPDYVAAEHPRAGAGAAGSGRARLSTCIWSMPMRCANPSAWRRSAIFLCARRRTGVTKYSQPGY